MTYGIRNLNHGEFQRLSRCSYCASMDLSIDKDRDNKYYIRCDSCGVSGPHLEGRVSAINGWNILGC